MMDGMGRVDRSGEACVTAPGPRRAERVMVGWARERRARAAGELGSPVRIVVPSRSLQRHVLAVLVRELGAVAGVVVQTHRGLAREVVERAGGVLPAGGAAVQEVLVRALAAEQGALAAALDGLEDGYAVVAAAVRDLLDAGLDGASVEAVAEAVAAAAAGRNRERCLAVVEVARGWLAAVERDGLPGRSALLVEAAELLAGGDPGLLPHRGILVHGFAEATGLVGALLEELVRRHGATLLLDLPPDPARPGERDAGWVFAERLADRVLGPGRLVREAAGAPARGGDEAALEAFGAPGPDAELREVAARIRGLLDGGVRPEEIGVVARSLDAATAAALRRQFGRLGIPFSGEGVTVPGGEARRRAAAALELLGEGEGARITAWLDAVEALPGVPDLRLAELALRSAGAERLGDLRELELRGICPGEALHLPVVTGTGGEEGSERLHRSLPREALDAILREGRELLELLGERPAEAPPARLLQWAGKVLGRLGLGEGPAAAALKGLAAELAGVGPVAWRHLEPLLARRLGSAGEEPLGGAGGGVQVLTVMEARSRTFVHLFLLGLNRGVFPRRIHEDPILPEGVRRAVAAVLPEMPLAERGRVEERYLFAQLLAAAPRVTLSWRTVDAEGRALNPSAFVERLILEGRLPAAGEIPTAADAASPDRGEGLRPAVEHGTAAGLVGDRAGLVEAARVLGDGRAEHLEPLLDEMDPPRPRSDPGPFLGLTGAGPPEELWATRLEAYSTCPWKQFLEYELGLAEPPEAQLAGTGLRGLLVGRVVHRVLERIVSGTGVPSGRGVTLAAVRREAAFRVVWPEERRLRALVAEAAREAAVREGVPLLAPALAAAALPYLERAREIDWKTGAAEGVLGAEVTGACDLPLEGQEPVQVAFRVDRVDRREDGTLVLSDYKTGKWKARPVTELVKGRRLQAALYARAAGEGSAGRYVFLGPESPHTESLVDHEETAPLDTTAGILLAAWREGITVPRWDPAGGDRNGPCRSCTVSEACLRDDTTFRHRLERVLKALRERDPGAPLLRLWELPRTEAPKGGSAKRRGGS